MEKVYTRAAAMSIGETDRRAEPVEARRWPGTAQDASLKSSALSLSKRAGSHRNGVLRRAQDASLKSSALSLSKRAVARNGSGRLPRNPGALSLSKRAGSHRNGVLRRAQDASPEIQAR